MIAFMRAVNLICEPFEKNKPNCIPLMLCDKLFLKQREAYEMTWGPEVQILVV